METLDGYKLMQKWIKVYNLSNGSTVKAILEDRLKFQKENGCSYEVVEASILHLCKNKDFLDKFMPMIKEAS